MPNLTLNQRRAREKRVAGGAHFRSPSEEVIDLSDFIEESLNGDDDWCGVDIEDKNLVDSTDDDILKELDTLEDNSIEKILERWRESVSRQDDAFFRRGESKRNKRQRNQNARELKEVATKSRKISNFYSPTIADVSSSSTGRLRHTNLIVEETMEDLMRADEVLILVDNDSVNDEDAVISLEDAVN